MDGKTSLLSVKNLHFGYEHTRPLLKDISFLVAAGEIFTILGSNGTGKSTLLACLERQFVPWQGQILVGGSEISSLSPGVLAKQMGFVAQNQSLAFDFTVRDYLVLGLAPHIGLLRVPGFLEYAQVDQVLEQMEISHLAHKSMLQISGGERQQAQIARVLVQNPKLILMDEPTNHLDYGNQIKVLKMIVALAKDRGIAIVLTTHVPDHAILLGGKAGILDRDGYMLTGKAEEIVTEENLRRIYQTDLCMAYVPEVGRVVCLTRNIR